MTRARRVTALVVVVSTVTVLTSIAVVEAGSRRRPDLRFADGVPQDVQALARATWERFTNAVPARWDCLAPVTLDEAWELEDRAAYDPDLRVVTLRIPGTAPNLEATLVHEFAHHLDFSCSDRAGVHARFLAAQGLSADTPWFAGGTWEQTPSEQFAEAMVVLVLGRGSPPPRIMVTPRAVVAIRAWGRGA
jgi:hypothetical protein